MHRWQIEWEKCMFYECGKFIEKLLIFVVSSIDRLDPCGSGKIIIIVIIIVLA